MKKFIIFLIFAICTSSAVIARDYTKLQIKEMKKSQKSGTTQYYVNQNVSSEMNIAGIKDPHIMKIGNYEIIDDKTFEKKLKADEKYYAKAEKNLRTKTWDNYNAQAKGSDYYHVYRIAERIIRANKLDYINWRIAFTRNSAEVNAFTTGTNYIDISTAMYDSFCDNDDALAMVIGHEMGHALLGHHKRNTGLKERLPRLERAARVSPLAALIHSGFQRKLLIDSKNQEYAADVEGVKLAMKAGYDINKGKAILNYLNTLPKYGEYWSTHPNAEHRIENVNQNLKYFPQQEWNDAGRYNIYKSDTLNVNLSSDRKSIVIASNPKLNPQNVYAPESLSEIYARVGYTAYTRGEFEKSLKYFNELFKLDKSNASAYLYASYASEALYKKTGKKGYLDDAKVYAESAQLLEPNNQYILEQIHAL